MTILQNYTNGDGTIYKKIGSDTADRKDIYKGYLYGGNVDKIFHKCWDSENIRYCECKNWKFRLLSETENTYSRELKVI